MPFDGSGNYSPPSAPAFPALGGTTIVAGYYNQVIQDIASGLSLCLTRDGQGRPSGPMDWNNQNLTNVADLEADDGTFTTLNASGLSALAAVTGTTATFSGAVTVASLTLTGGGLAVAQGGTGQTTYTNGQILIGNTTGNTLVKATLTAGTGISITNGSGSITINSLNNGTVTSVALSGGSTGLSFSGSPITTSGTMTLSGTLALANGGTGATTKAAARTALGVASATGSGASGTWDIDISGNAATATTATTANALNTANDYRVDSLGVGTNASGVTGEIRATNDVTAFYSSDITLKENIKLIPDALEKVGKLRGVTFDWIDDYITERGGEDDYFIRKRDVGVIAQEVQRVLPEVIGIRPNGKLAVKYDRLVALLINAINELQEEVSRLKGE